MIKSTLLIFCLVSVSVVAMPQAVNAQCGQGRTFLGIPSWDRGLRSCESISLSDFEEDQEDVNPALVVALNIIEALMRIAGMVAMAFLIIAGFKYVLSEGNPQKVAEAQATVLNALIGLVIAVLGVAAIRAALKVFGVD